MGRTSWSGVWLDVLSAVDTDVGSGVSVIAGIFESDVLVFQRSDPFAHEKSGIDRMMQSNNAKIRLQYRMFSLDCFSSL